MPQQLRVPVGRHGSSGSRLHRRVLRLLLQDARKALLDRTHSWNTAQLAPNCRHKDSPLLPDSSHKLQPLTTPLSKADTDADADAGLCSYSFSKKH